MLKFLSANSKLKVVTIFVMAFCISLSVNIADGSYSLAFAAEKKVGFFERIFGKRKGTKAKAPKKVVRRKKVVRKGPAIKKKFDDAEVILVAGDFFANSLARGLQEAFAKDQAVKIVNIANNNSGLVRLDVVDWATYLPQQIAKHSPSAVVFMAGANDRRKLSLSSGEYEKLSEDWSIVYRTRIVNVAASVTLQNVPFFWISAPPVNGEKMQSDFLAINNLIETELSIEAGEFINIWDHFVDDNGAYTQKGADITGRVRLLRTKDGINFNRAGRRKMAFYVEQPLRAFVIGNDSNIFALTQGANGLLRGKKAPGLQKTTPMMALDFIDIRATLAGGPKALDELKKAQEKQIELANSDQPKEAEESKIEQEKSEEEVVPQMALVNSAQITKAPSGRVDAVWNQ